MLPVPFEAAPVPRTAGTSRAEAPSRLEGTHHEHEHTHHHRRPDPPLRGRGLLLEGQARIAAFFAREGPGGHGAFRDRVALDFVPHFPEVRGGLPQRWRHVPCAHSHRPRSRGPQEDQMLAFGSAGLLRFVFPCLSRSRSARGRTGRSPAVSAGHDDSQLPLREQHADVPAGDHVRLGRSRGCCRRYGLRVPARGGRRLLFALLRFLGHRGNDREKHQGHARDARPRLPVLGAGEELRHRGAGILGRRLLPADPDSSRPQISGTTANQVILSFSQGDSRTAAVVIERAGADGYFRQIDSKYFYEICPAGSVLTVVDSGLAPGTYSYRAWAFNQGTNQQIYSGVVTRLRQRHDRGASGRRFLLGESRLREAG